MHPEHNIKHLSELEPLHRCVFKEQVLIVQPLVREETQPQQVTYTERVGARLGLCGRFAQLHPFQPAGREQQAREAVGIAGRRDHAPLYRLTMELVQPTLPDKRGS